ncbi:unnamed protein product [Ceutorhynchus assimilis]|uniref:Uncharacterized protein n=1 Tax=Ceutorhynchus assimilis TaxID=467358 RepID=A0A9N9MVH7_9CUCU|nr:unnamed protein product [Ceutorhynchus assimilis]
MTGKIMFSGELLTQGILLQLKVYTTLTVISILYLTHESGGLVVGRPYKKYVFIATEQIQCCIEQNKDSEISLENLMEIVSGKKPTIETVKSKLKEIYGGQILIGGSYYDAIMLKLSAIYHPQEPPPTDTFTQFIFDNNADFNVVTLDGLNTYHSMGGILCITPAGSVPVGKEIKKLTNAPTTTQTETL